MVIALKEEGFYVLQFLTWNCGNSRAEISAGIECSVDIIMVAITVYLKITKYESRALVH